MSPVDSGRNHQTAAIFECCGVRVAIVGASDGTRQHTCTVCGERWTLIMRSSAIVSAFIDAHAVTPARARALERAAGSEMARMRFDDPERRELYRMAWEWCCTHPRLAAVLGRLPDRFASRAATWLIVPRDLRRKGVRV